MIGPVGRLGAAAFVSKAELVKAMAW